MARAFSDALALASPSGKISKRSLKSAQEKIRKELFGSGLAFPSVNQPSERASLLRQAAELRTLAGRGMKPRAYLKKAAELEQRAGLLENPRSIGKKLHVKPLPAVALDIGDFVAVIYRSRRDGNLYRHEFAARSRPLLAVSQDGTQLLVLGGAYRFTSRGIVDV